MIELEHSPLGGSGAYRFMTCAGSFLLHKALLENDEFEDSPSDFARLGTAAHELCALCLSERREPYEYIGKDFDGYVVGAPDGINLDAVTAYFNECMDIRENQGCELIEASIHLPHLHPLLKGTVDFGFYNARGIWLRDYKNGEGVGVAPTMNRQLLYYAFLMIEDTVALRNARRDLPVSLGIVQPNFYGLHEPSPSWMTTVGFVLDWGHKELLPQMHKLTVTQDVEESDFVPGNHCQFCSVLLDCPKMQKAFLDYANASEDIAAMLTDKEIDEFYSRRDSARRFMTALEKVAYARLVSGVNLTSAKLVERKVNREWKADAETALRDVFGEKAFEPAKIKSPAQIEKLSSRGKEMALEYGYKPESAGLSLAPATDPRPAAKPAMNAEVFSKFQGNYQDQGF